MGSQTPRIERMDQVKAGSLEDRVLTVPRRRQGRECRTCFRNRQKAKRAAGGGRATSHVLGAAGTWRGSRELPLKLTLTEPCCRSPLSRGRVGDVPTHNPLFESASAKGTAVTTSEGRCEPSTYHSGRLPRRKKVTRAFCCSQARSDEQKGFSNRMSVSMGRIFGPRSALRALRGSVWDVRWWMSVGTWNLSIAKKRTWRCVLPPPDYRAVPPNIERDVRARVSLSRPGMRKKKRERRARLIGNVFRA